MMMRQLSTYSQSQIPLALAPIHAGPAAHIGGDYKMLDVANFITRGKEGIVAYEVTGDSMVGCIQPGATIFVDPCIEARHGDVVAASINETVCVKILGHSPRGLYLISANKQYPPREITAQDDFKVLGVVTAHLVLHRQ